MRAAFSLVELSIVLVILGLLTGGILAGQSLIRASELRAVSSEYTRYVTASRSFRDKYFALPGDITNATMFWGAAATCPPTNTAPLTSQATCNGNGDGMIQVDAVTANEAFTFWQHLTNAGLIEGKYNGTSNSATYSAGLSLVGVNVPRSKVDSSAEWIALYLGNTSISNTLWIEGSYGNFLSLRSYDADGFSEGGAIIRPEETWNIDLKMDDGKPGTGNLVVSELRYDCFLLANGSPGSRSSTDPRTDTQYNLNSSSKSCMLFFRNAF